MSRKKVLGMRKEMGDYLRGKIEEGALEDYGSGRVSDYSFLLSSLRSAFD